MDAPIRRSQKPNHPTAAQLERPRLRRPDRHQTFFEPVNLDERRPADHGARVV